MTAVMTRTRSDPDTARMVRVRRGDVVAFAELVERYWGPVVGRFVRQLGDRQEAEDLAQDVFLRLYRARRRYRARKFSTWLFHVAANVAQRGAIAPPPALPPAVAIMRTAAGRCIFAALSARPRRRPDTALGACRVGRPGARAGRACGPSTAGPRIAMRGPVLSPDRRRAGANAGSD